MTARSSYQLSARHRWPLLALGICGGCLDSSSHLSPHFVAHADGTQTYVSALLFDVSSGRAEGYVLDANDYVEATIGDTHAALTRSTTMLDVNGARVYDAILPLQPAPGDAVTFSLQWRSHDEVLVSTSAFPSPLDLDPLPATASRAQDLLVTWNGTVPGDAVWYEALGNCFAPTVNSGDDVGSLVIPAGFLQGGSGSCPATLYIGREHIGTLDSTFEDGAVVAANLVPAMFTSTP